MALINCPECGNEVSDKAEKCPKCAYPIKKMVQRVCPECGTSVSDKDEKCPKCAYPLKTHETIPRTVPPNPNNNKPEVIIKSKEGCFLQTLNVGCMIVAGVIGLIVLIFLVRFCNH